MGRFHLVSSSEKYSLSHQERNSGGRDLILSADQKAEKKNHQHLIGFVFFSVRNCSLENAPPLGRDQVFFLQLNASQLSLNPMKLQSRLGTTNVLGKPGRRGVEPSCCFWQCRSLGIHVCVAIHTLSEHCALGHMETSWNSHEALQKCYWAKNMTNVNG